MFKSKKNSKEKFRSRSQEKPSSKSETNVRLDEKQVNILTKWLDQLNKEKLIIVTDQNDIVIMVGGRNDPAQQLFVNCNDIDDYLDNKAVNFKTRDKSDIISMSDIARILLKFGYVTESSGQLSFAAHTIALNNDELTWLKSIIRDAVPDSRSRVTQVRLFDGENDEILSIPYEYMSPTNDTNVIANYLFRNGDIRYDVDNGTYAYRYVEPDILLDEYVKSPQRISQHQFLSYHIEKIHVDQRNKRIELQFRHELNRNLVLPDGWFRQIADHHFDRDYIIDTLLANGGVINQNAFVFMGRTYSLEAPRITKTNSASVLDTPLKIVNLSSREKNDIIRQYVNLVVDKDGTKLDESNQLLLLLNPADGRRLYFTPEHSEYIRRNGCQRLDVIQILVNYALIKQSEYGYWLLYYNNQYIRLPSSIVYLYNLDQLNHSRDRRASLNIQQSLPSNPRTTIVNNGESMSLERYHNIIDYMCRHGLVTWDKPAKVIKLHFTDQTLLLPIDHLRSIIDPRALNSSYTGNDLPFTSRQLSQWLINNSYITRKNV